MNLVERTTGFGGRSALLEPQELLSELIQIPSTYEHEHEMLDFVENYLDQLGVAYSQVAYDVERLYSLSGAVEPFSRVKGRRCVVAKYPGRGGGRSLVLSCHVDVVPAGPAEDWTHTPFSGRIDDEKIFGRGAMDDKAGVALALLLLRRLIDEDAQLSGDLLVQFVIEDEITGNGTLLTLDAGNIGDAAIIMDGTRGDTAIYQHAGNLQFGIKVAGSPASVSVSHMGLNAAEYLCELLLRLRTEIFSWNDGRSAPWTQFPSPNQFVTQSMSSVGRALTVPDHAEAVCYMTFTPPGTIREIRERIENVVHSFAAGRVAPEVTIQWDGFFAAEPVETTDQTLVSVLHSVSQKLGWEPIRLVPSTGTSDMRHFVARGIPCLLFGPGRGFNPHRADEHFYLEDLSKMTDLMSKFVAEWCGREFR